MNQAQIDEIDKLLDVVQRLLQAKDQGPEHWEAAKVEVLGAASPVWEAELGARPEAS